MVRTVIVALIAAVCLRTLCAPAAAAPPSYDIFCSPGLLQPAGSNRDGLVQYTMTTGPGSAQSGAAVCGWFTREWRAGEPKQLCFPANLPANGGLARLEPGASLTVPQVSSFAVYNDFRGCMVVTAVVPNESHAFPPIAMQCNGVFHSTFTASAGGLPAYAYRIAPTDVETGTCTAPPGAPIPQQGFLCSNAVTSTTPSQVAVSVKPWWPCGLATISTPPATAFTLNVPVRFAFPIARYTPPYKVICSVIDSTFAVGALFYGRADLPTLHFSQGAAAVSWQQTVAVAMLPTSASSDTATLRASCSLQAGIGLPVGPSVVPSVSHDFSGAPPPETVMPQLQIVLP